MNTPTCFGYKSPSSGRRNPKAYKSHISNSLFFSHGTTSPSGPGPPHCRGWDSTGRVIGPKQSPLRDNTQHSQETDIHAPGGIRTRNPSKLAAADSRFKPRDHWNRPNLHIRVQFKTKMLKVNKYLFLIFYF
jgi:hypothetical protein